MKVSRISLIALIASGLVLAACQAPSSQVTDLDSSTLDTQNTQTEGETMDYRGDITELKSVDTKVGTGQEAKPGDTVEVHYTGKLINGTVFDSSKPRNKTFEFVLGEGYVIQGWDEGVVGMKVGGTRTLSIPPEMGYGARGAAGAIPGNASLIFDVELISIK